MKLDLDLLAKLDKEGKSAPWRIDRTLEFLDSRFKFRVVSEASDLRESRRVTDCCLTEEDAGLIVELRNALPAMLAELRAAREAIRKTADYIDMGHVHPDHSSRIWGYIEAYYDKYIRAIAKKNGGAG